MKQVLIELFIGFIVCISVLAIALGLREIKERLKIPAELIVSVTVGTFIMITLLFMMWAFGAMTLDIYNAF